MTWEVGTKAARRINPAPSKTSQVRPRRPIARLHTMLAHIDPSEEVTSAVKQGEDRDRTDEGGKKVATENKCSPNAGAIGSLQETVES